MGATRSLFLELPVELRLLIYDFALFDQEDITIATGLNKTTGFPSVTDSGYASADDDDEDSVGIAGLPSTHRPLIRNHYCPQLLAMESQPAGTDLILVKEVAGRKKGKKRARRLAAEALPFSTPLAFLRTNRQIKAEIEWHLGSQRVRDLKSCLYLTYPYGLIALQTLCPDVIRQVRSIHISGYYHPPPAPPKPDARWRRWVPSYGQPPSIDASVYGLANTALRKLVRTILSPKPRVPMEKLEMRIYYPSGGNGSIWADDSSPITIALHNTCGGIIDSCVWNGNTGSGSEMTINPHATRRIVLQKWKRMSEECEDWVVNPKWPQPHPAPGERILPIPELAGYDSDSEDDSAEDGSSADGSSE